MKKIIGIPGWKTGENSFGCTIPYLDFGNEYGSVRILDIDDFDAGLDLLILPGGPDVDPSRYGTKPHYLTSRPDPMKEYFDLFTLPKYIEAGIPVFGICRGMQSLAVHFGAILIQDMDHETNESDKRGSKVHELRMEDNPSASVIAKSIGKIHRVNSMHHQCVSGIGFPFDELDIIAGRPQDPKRHYPPCIEAIKHKTLPIFGVQYHPEELDNDNLSEYIMNNLLKIDD